MTADVRATCEFLRLIMDSLSGEVPATVDLVLKNYGLHVCKFDAQLEIHRGEMLKGKYYR